MSDRMRCALRWCAPFLVALWILTGDPAVVAAGNGFAMAMADDTTIAPLEEENEVVERSPPPATQGFVRRVRRLVRGVVFTTKRIALIWWRWMRRSVLFVGFAVLALVADRQLLRAWRARGLNVFTAYVPLMMYVFVALLIDRRIQLAGKAMLGLAITYGVSRVDMWPDRTRFPGLVDDLVMIFVAMRTFLATCPDGIVNEHAERALRWRRRTLTLRRVRSLP